MCEYIFNYSKYHKKTTIIYLTNVQRFGVHFRHVIGQNVPAAQPDLGVRTRILAQLVGLRVIVVNVEVAAGVEASKIVGIIEFDVLRSVNCMKCRKTNNIT